MLNIKTWSSTYVVGVDLGTFRGTLTPELTIETLDPSSLTEH